MNELDTVYVSHHGVCIMFSCC